MRGKGGEYMWYVVESPLALHVVPILDRSVVREVSETTSMSGFWRRGKPN